MSSTVSLSGKLNYDETTKEWTWSGQWAFGNSVAKALALPVPKRGPTASKPRTQPFMYTWTTAAQPGDIPVPSLNFSSAASSDETDEAADAAVPATTATLSSNDKKDVTDATKHDQTTIDATDSTTTDEISHLKPTEKAEAKIESTGTTKTDDEKSDPQKGGDKSASSQPNVKTNTNDDGNKKSDLQEKDSLTKATNNDKSINQSSKEIQNTTDHNEIKQKSDHQSYDSKKTDKPVTVEKGEGDTVMADATGAYAEKSTTNEGKLNEKCSTEASTSTAQSSESVSTTTTPVVATTKNVLPITFASVMPGFTDLHTKYGGNGNPDSTPVIPQSGRWKGHFDNISGRDKKQKMVVQKIEETFYLFLNATPTKDAKYAFEDDGLDNVSDGDTAGDETLTSAEDEGKNASNTSQLVQIRGCGENQFGDFEIFGCLNVDTMKMEIQRQYVFPPEVDKSHSTPRQRKSGPSTTPSSSRPTSKRKRQPTWKRMTSDQEEDDQKQRRKRAKQEQQQTQSTQPLESGKTPSQNSVADQGPSTNGTAQQTPTSSEYTNTVKESGVGTAISNSSTSTSLGGLVPLTTSTDKVDSISSNLVPKSNTAQPQSSAIPMPMNLSTGGTTSSGLSPLKISLPSQFAAGGPSSTASTPTVSSKGGSGRRSKSKRSSGSTPGSTAAGAAARNKAGATSSTPVPPSNIRLPPAGDPKKARWRAPHFLYYQRHDPTESSTSAGDSGNSPKSAAPAPVPATPKYVIYTGEMAEGKREGRGLCLYNNGTLYQGFWKGGKEHGYGTIVTADRRKIIFEGNFERGKIQGYGTYYYSSSGQQANGPRYIGEFRENQRNGMGRYIWSDGSEFNGNWNQDQMTHGTFTWADGSTYTGGFKDSKRSGPGVLRASDGFVYDGMWDNNAMEGRGLAIYPSGQRFEGLFSKGRREGRGTIFFTNGAVYEGRFRDDAVDGQGTMKMTKAAVVPRDSPADSSDGDKKEEGTETESKKEDFMIPISFASDIAHIHARAGFTAHGE
jgi:hypothetical protein